MKAWKNQLYFGDNLDILRTYVPTDSVDLIYLDPPFNSKATYNVLFQEKSGDKSAAQITAFEDSGKRLEYPYLGPGSQATFPKAPRKRKGPTPEENQGNLWNNQPVV